MLRSATYWNAENLQSLRTVGDPLADAVVADLFAAGGMAAMNDLMRSLVVNEYPVPEDVSPLVHAYLQQSRELPSWADPALIQAGEQVFWRFGPRLILILSCYALPFCYLGRNGAPVLAMTNRLISNPTRRIVETAQLVVDVMQPGGLTSPNGRGRLTIQKVRLMHAAIRRLAPQSPEWKEEFGLPVNQEDLAGTLMSFSWISIDGLTKLGIDLSDRDKEGYIHCWNVVGYLLGVHEDLLPADVAAAKGLSDAIAAHEFGPSPSGQMLSSSLNQMIANILPGNVFDRAPDLLNRFFLGDQGADWLGLKPASHAALAVSPLRIAGKVLGDAVASSSAIQLMAEQVGKLLIGAILLCERGTSRPAFSIPTELQQTWGVNWTA